MGSRQKDEAPPHQQPLLSSLVVRPSTTDGPPSPDLHRDRDRDPPLSYSRSPRYPRDPPGLSSISLPICSYVAYPI